MNIDQPLSNPISDIGENTHDNIGHFLNNIDNLHIRNLILGDKDRVKVEIKPGCYLILDRNRAASECTIIWNK